MMEIGVDITTISRFKNRSDRFIRTILGDEEYNLYLSLNPNLKETFLATRWASKEAIFKAINDKDYLKYQILNSDVGKPYVLNHPEIKISISHENDSVIAFVVIEN